MRRLTDALKSLLLKLCAPFNWLAKTLLLSLIKAYQYLLSPWVGNQCRFHPTCSHYAIEAINRFGVIKGGYLMLRRLLKCQPWHKGGFDPVPEAFASDEPKKSCNCSKKNS